VPSSNRGNAPPPPETLPPYAVRKSLRARRMSLRVSASGRVEVVVPAGAAQRSVEAFVLRHGDWLRRTVARVEQKPVLPPAALELLPKRIELRAVREQWEVEYRDEPGRRLALWAAGERTLVLRGGCEDAHAGAALLREWLSAAARAHLLPWLQRLSEEIGLPYRSATVRAQQTRWGSCSSRKTISVNRALLLLDPEVVRYLFVHELCHTVHLNHSPAYWRLVAAKEPGYRQLDARLRQASGELPLWACRS
jgi:predicted metal-dependent hydrolase